MTATNNVSFATAIPIVSILDCDAPMLYAQGTDAWYATMEAAQYLEDVDFVRSFRMEAVCKASGSN